MSARPLYTFHRAQLGYPGTPVLTGVQLEIEQGQFVGILGPNGSGKSTLLKTVLGLLPCLKGRLERHAEGIRLGYVPQKERLDPIFPVTAYDVAAMGAYRKLELLSTLRGLDQRPRVERCLAECGASAFAGKRYGELSGGQRQRVLIARALAAEPELLALDEPLAGLDVATQKSLIELLGRLKEQRGLTVLMVSHRVRAERRLFSHVVWCDDGKAAMGPADKMLSGGALGDLFGAELG